MNDVELALRLTADAKDATDGLDSVADAAEAMATEVDNAAGKADAATSKLTGVADASDAVDTKMGGATASLGALSGGLEAAGFEGAAGALGTLGTATDFAAGAGQGLTLILETEKAQMLLAKAATIGKTVADKAMAIGTKAAAAAQWLLNAALNANPLGAVILLIGLLVGGFILAYKKSETFRNIVDGAMSGAKAAVQTVVDVIKDVRNFIGNVVDKVPSMSDVFKTATDLIKGYIDIILTPIQAVKDLIEWVIDHLKDLEIPKWAQGLLGKVGVGGKLATLDVAVPATAVVSAPAVPAPVVQVVIEHALIGDELYLAQVIQRILSANGVRLGTA